MRNTSAFARLLPEQKRRIAPWIVGLVTFVTLTVGAAGLSLLGAVGDLKAAAENRWSLQVSGPPADFERSVRLLRADPQVAAVAPVPQAALQASLEAWLGPAATASDLPLPQLADVTLREGSGGSALAARLEQAVPSARLTAYDQELRPVVGSLRGLGLLVAGLLIILALTMAAAVTLAARATLDSNRATLDILHGIGATDDQLLSLLQRRIALDALIGGVIGGAVAGLVLAAALLPARGVLGQLAGRPLLGVPEIALLAALPLLQAGLATVVARRALKKALSAIT